MCRWMIVLAVLQGYTCEAVNCCLTVLKLLQGYTCEAASRCRIELQGYTFTAGCFPWLVHGCHSTTCLPSCYPARSCTQMDAGATMMQETAAIAVKAALAPPATTKEVRWASADISSLACRCSQCARQLCLLGENFWGPLWEPSAWSELVRVGPTHNASILTSRCAPGLQGGQLVQGYCPHCICLSKCCLTA